MAMHALPSRPLPLRSFARLIDGASCFALGLVLPLWPPFASLVARDRRYIKHYRATFTQATLHLKALYRAQVISRNFLRTRSEMENVNITGGCTHCGRCCTFNACMFLESAANGQTRCSIYGSWFFKALSCGDYPMTAEDIAIYDCPTFIATPREVIVQGSRLQRVIRIVADKN